MKLKVVDISTQFVPKQCIEGIGLVYPRGVCERVIFGSSYGGIGVLAHSCGLGELGTVNIFSVFRFLQMCIGRDGFWFLRLGLNTFGRRPQREWTEESMGEEQV